MGQLRGLSGVIPFVPSFHPHPNHNRNHNPIVLSGSARAKQRMTTKMKIMITMMMMMMRKWDSSRPQRRYSLRASVPLRLT